MILGLVRMILPAQLYGVVDIVLDVLIWLTLIVIILVYRLMVEMNSKKPLKFTPRVKRMIGTDIFVCLLAAGIIALALFAEGSAGGI